MNENCYRSIETALFLNFMQYSVHDLKPCANRNDYTHNLWHRNISFITSRQQHHQPGYKLDSFCEL